jgi:hypothetical protein
MSFQAWPALQRRAGGGAAAQVSVPPARLPDGYLSATWQPNAFLNITGGNINGDDRSGNGYHCGAINPTAGPSIVPGMAALSRCDMNYLALFNAPAPLRPLGSMAFVAVVAGLGYWPTGSPGNIGGAGYPLDPAATANISWQLRCGSVPGATISYYAERSTHVAVTYAPVLPDINDGERHMVSLRRTGGTSVTLGVHDAQNPTGVYATSGVLSAPTGGGGPAVYAACGGLADGVSQMPFFGQIEEIWFRNGTPPTNAELLAMYRILFGS